MKTEIEYNIPVKFVDDIDYENLFKKQLPQQKTIGSAGHDVFAVGEPKIIGEREPNTNLWNRVDYIEYRTGIKIGPENSDLHVLAFPRSSISKYNLVLANSVGVVDSDYRGEIFLRFKYIFQPEDLAVVRNNMDLNEKTFMLGVVGNVNWEKIYRSGHEICQLIGYKNVQTRYTEVSELSDTVRGSGAFGSTDTHKN